MKIGVMVGHGLNNIDESLRKVAELGIHSCQLSNYDVSIYTPALAREIMEACREEGIYLPVHAIGGIRENDIQPILNTGVTGIALSSLLKNSEDIVGKTREIVEQLKIKKLPPPFGVLPL